MAKLAFVSKPQISPTLDTVWLHAKVCFSQSLYCLPPLAGYSAIEIARPSDPLTSTMSPAF